MVDEQQLFREVTYNLMGLVQRVMVRTIRSDKQGKTSVDIDLESDLDSFKEQRHRSFGRCYTFHPKKSLRNLGVYYVVFYL